MVFTVALAAVGLTALVVVRQINALRDNRRLLHRVDAGQLELAHRANHDDLTDLANRALFEQRTREALARRPAGTLSVALIDLDDFKAINDRLGHAVGDALLVVVAQRLRVSGRTDTVARLGGDEFGLLLHGLRRDEATDVLARITDALSRPVHALGLRPAGPRQRRPGRGMAGRRARRSCCAAPTWRCTRPRNAARAGTRCTTPNWSSTRRPTRQLGAELRQALDNGELLAASTSRSCGCPTAPGPAWRRWSAGSTPERGVVGPDVFIPIAERTGLIVPLGDWILRTALRQAVEWDERVRPGRPAARSASTSPPASCASPASRTTSGRRWPRPASTRSGWSSRSPRPRCSTAASALDALQDLVGLGVKVALDDFGTGHSSLGLLRTCPVDTLKVDKSFVDGIGGRSEEAVIATAMIQITNGLHLQAIAEGVETAEQADTLYRLGYRFAQGYHFSRPLSPGQVRERLDLVTISV